MAIPTERYLCSKTVHQTTTQHMTNRKNNSDNFLGGFFSLLAVIFACYTLANLDKLMVAMDRATGLTP